MPVLHDLSSRKSIISFSGTDAESFLQSQTTCDVTSLSSHNSAFGALCNPKGRVICLFHLFKIEQTIYMVLNSELSEAIIKRLKMFVFRSDVQIKDVSDQYVALGSANNIEDKVKNEFKPLAIIQHEPSVNLSMLIIGNSSYQQLANGSTIVFDAELDNWDRALTSECFPDINSSTSELFIPQMLNMDALEGISFQKGCYTGQEVIARLHYKGSVKKRLVSYNSEKRFQVSENIFLADDSNSIGTILSSIGDKNCQYTGLIVLKTSVLNNELVLQDNTKLVIQHPKYDLN